MYTIHKCDSSKSHFPTLQFSLFCREKGWQGGGGGQEEVDQVELSDFQQFTGDTICWPDIQAIHTDLAVLANRGDESDFLY